jgi:hypothetical protein
LKEGEEGKFSLLHELFDICHGVYVSVDLKDNPPEAIEKVEALIKQYKREEYTLWGSMKD